MTYIVRLNGPAKKQLRKLDRSAQSRIVTALKVLAVNPRPPGARMLQDDPERRWRVRIGDHRVIYSIDDGVLTVLVVRVAHRREAYD